MFTVATECGGRAHVDRTRARRAGPRSESLFPVPESDELLAMAEGMASTARRWPGLVGLTTRRFELLASSDTFEAWVIGWPPGGIIELHDHGASAGAVTVAGGELVETRVTESHDGSVSTRRLTMTAGTSWSMGRRHIHDVVNPGRLPAVSVHVYAPRLTSMTHYRIVGERLRAERTVRYRMGEVVP